MRTCPLRGKQTLRATDFSATLALMELDLDHNTPPRPHVVAVVPARYGAQRLPGKPLVPLHGKPMVQWVAEAAARVEGVDEVLVATDDERIAEAVAAFGGTAVMTPASCPSGTDRIQQALAGRRADVVINIQGDEPGMQPASVKRALDALLDNKAADVSTVCVPIASREEFEAPHVVKVVRGDGDRALYFSRAPIPSLARRDLAGEGAVVYGYKHLGMYIYRRESLEAFTRFDQSDLERIEKLEQLRFLSIGATIVCPEVEHDSIGVDVEDDVPRAEAMLAKLYGL